MIRSGPSPGAIEWLSWGVGRRGIDELLGRGLLFALLHAAFELFNSIAFRWLGLSGCGSFLLPGLLRVDALKFEPVPRAIPAKQLSVRPPVDLDDVRASGAVDGDCGVTLRKGDCGRNDRGSHDYGEGVFHHGTGRATSTQNEPPVKRPGVQYTPIGDGRYLG